MKYVEQFTGEVGGLACPPDSGFMLCSLFTKILMPLHLRFGYPDLHDWITHPTAAFSLGDRQQTPAGKTPGWVARRIVGSSTPCAPPNHRF